MSTFATEVNAGARFKFGKNWQSFLAVLGEARIRQAETALREMLGVTDLLGQTFVDVGSGSGLSSLAARNLGAPVTSFDFDPSSVACTHELRRRYHADDTAWSIQEGSVLDAAFLASLGQFDVVYSWGVLHHTGKMWEALANVIPLVKPGGRLFLALYNDQGRASKLWRTVKHTYCAGWMGKALVSSVFIPYFFGLAVISCILNRENVFATYKHKSRGMSVTHDWFDWLGGYPFEVCRADEVFTFYQQRGFLLTTLSTTSNLGNNQFVVVRTPQ